MEYLTWGIMIVWFFLLVVGRAWKESLFTIAGGIVGFVLAMEILETSFIFAVALFLINAWIVWVALAAEV